MNILFKTYSNTLFTINISSAKHYPSISCFIFFQKIYSRSLLKQYLFFKNIFIKKVPFFVLSNNFFFLKMFALPILIYQNKIFKKRTWGWFWLYDLVKFKTPLWLKYVYFILKRNKIPVVVSILDKTQQSWLKYLRQKNFVIVGLDNPKFKNDVYDFPLYAPEYFNDFYVFFVFDLFIKNSNKQFFKYVFFFFSLRKWIAKKKWSILL